MLSDYLPFQPQGHILLTTRAHAMSGMAQKVEVAQMDEAEGVHLLLHRAGLIDQQTTVERLPGGTYQQATAIFHLLGGLPLALDQAGAYIEKTHESLSNYSTLYQTKRKELHQERGGISSEIAAKEEGTRKRVIFFLSQGTRINSQCKDEKGGQVERYGAIPLN